jgi:hypothetical protein
MQAPNALFTVDLFQRILKDFFDKQAFGCLIQECQEKWNRTFLTLIETYFDFSNEATTTRATTTASTTSQISSSIFRRHKQNENQNFKIHFTQMPPFQISN